MSFVLHKGFKLDVCWEKIDLYLGTISHIKKQNPLFVPLSIDAYAMLFL